MTTILFVCLVVVLFSLLLFDAEREAAYWRREAERHRAMWARITEDSEW